MSEGKKESAGCTFVSAPLRKLNLFSPHNEKEITPYIFAAVGTFNLVRAYGVFYII